ncbi:MAG: hypothetical protein C0412_00680 [Flavobacterium sp.]|nr:hypothetical protein [Flavobacterium sp.]
MIIFNKQTKRKKTVILIFITITIIIGLYFTHLEISRFFYLTHCVVWNKEVKIKYEDFQQEPENNSQLDIVFWHGFDLTSSPFRKAHVIAVFDKNQSWIKDTTKFNFQELLVIQKIAFNLTESYARICNNEIKRKGYEKNGNQKPFEDLVKIKDSVFKKYKIVKNQMLNDETRNNSQLIQYWKPKVDKMLEETNKYPAPRSFP